MSDPGNIVGDETMQVDDNADFKSNEEPHHLSALLGKNLQETSNFPLKESWTVHTDDERMNAKNDEKVFEAMLQTKSSTRLKSLWKQLWKSRDLPEHQVIASSSFMVKLMEKLVNPNHPWDPSVITTIISCDMISTRVCPGLIQAALEHEEYDLLCSCFVHLQDVDEKDIVLCLNTLLPIHSEDLHPKLETLIFELLKMPFTENSFVEEFRLLQFERAMILMAYLSSKLKSEHLLVNSIINQIFKWLSMLVDSHFSHIIIHPETWQIIVDLQETMTVQMELYKDLTDLDLTLNKIHLSIAAKKLRADRQKGFLYKIEYMSI